MNYKRLLIISHNCLSKSGSNGRTLANLIDGWPKDKMAQFYIHSEYPRFDICDRYYCIPDIALLKSLLKRNNPGWVVEQKEETSEKIATVSPGKKDKLKNSIFILFREALWKSRLWKRTRFEKWVSDFSPEVVLIQAGDAGFLFDLAIDISRKYHASIVVYNTEGYYFKDVSYLAENRVSNLVYPKLHRCFQKAYDNLIETSKAEIYNCDLLRDDYEAVFHTDSKVILTTSDLTEDAVCTDKLNRIVYAGNLGVNRHKSLIEFANALQKLSLDMVVDVYGKTPDEAVKAELASCAGIHLHGFIPYDELKQILKHSKYLLHIESFDPFYKEDLKYAFSTKIADSLAAGACLFVYAPENMAVIQYLQGKDAAALITEPDSLEEKIAEVLQNEALCRTYAENGRKLAEENHNLRKNREKFQQILLA